MNPPRCKLFPLAEPYSAKKVVRSLRYNVNSLDVEIEGKAFGRALVVFWKPLGFRVLDERDLCEFWNQYSEPNGWLYEVEEGGWLELESHRPLFNSSSFFPGLREFFIVDDNCISVMTVRPPEIVDLRRNRSADHDRRF